MTKTPHIAIGTANGKEFRLRPDTVTSTIVVLGGKGMGKTNLGGVLVEEIDAQGERWCAIDPLGVWWGLRHSIDGKGPGIECVILGGPHGDIPIEPTGGAVAADLVVDERANVIIDISRKPNGEMWGMGERIRFAKDFAKRLFQRQGELVDGQRREPIFVELDEAATFIPQIFPSGNFDIAECISAWQTLVEWGRNVGIGVGLLTQRSARINKSVTEVADALFSFRIVGPNSVKAVTDWLGEHVPKERVREHVETLRSLERGRCLIVSPGWLNFEGVVDVRLRHTFDSSATPKPGERQKRVTGKAAKPDLAAYQERMKETIERARENDPKVLRQQIQQMRTELANFGKAKEFKTANTALDQKTVDRAVEAERKRSEVAMQQLKIVMEESMLILTKITLKGFDAEPINAEEMESALKKAAQEIGRLAAAKIKAKELEFDALKKECDRLLRRAKAVVDSVATGNITVGVSVTKNEPVTVRPVAEMPAPRAPKAVTEPGEAAPLGSVAKQIAGILAAYWPEPIKRSILAAMCGLVDGGNFSGRLSELRSNELLEDPARGLLKATEKCRDLYFDTFQPPKTTEEVIALWTGKFGELAIQILRKLVEAEGEPIRRGDLAAALGLVDGGNFSGRLSEVRSAGLLVDPGRGLVAANCEALFLNKHQAATA